MSKLISLVNELSRYCTSQGRGIASISFRQSKGDVSLAPVTLNMQDGPIQLRLVPMWLQDELRDLMADDLMAYAASGDRIAALHDIAWLAETAAQKRGFDACGWQNLPGKVAFVFGEDVEVGEAETCDELAEELADTGLRLLAILHGVYGADWSPRPVTAVEPVFPCSSTDALTRLVRKHLRGALEAWRDDDRDGARLSLELALYQLLAAGRRVGYDLVGAMVQKLKDNEGRPRLHGHVNTLG